MTLADILVEISLLLQQKYDRDGSEVSEADTNTRLGAYWLNAVDDWLMAAQENIDDLKTTVDALSAGAALVFDSRTSGSATTASITSGGGTGNFTITGLGARTTVQWLSVTSNAPSTGGRVQFYVDSGRTKECYNSEIMSGDPPVDATSLVDGMAWGAFSDDGTGLTGGTLYGKITNDGASNSTYTIKMVAIYY